MSSGGAGKVQCVPSKNGGRPASYLAASNSCASRMPVAEACFVSAVGAKGLPFSMPSDLQLIDHDPIAIEPRFALHDPVEPSKKLSS